MNKYLKHKGIIIFTIIFILFIATIFFVFKDTLYIENNPEIKDTSSFENSTNNSYIANTEKEIEEIRKKENITGTSTFTSTLEDAPMTSKLNFKIGEKYVYDVNWPNNFKFQGFENKTNRNMVLYDYVYFQINFTVDKKERINKTDCFVISTNGSGEVVAGVVNIEGVLRPMKIYPFKEASAYIDTETGNIVKESCFTGSLRIYSPWMLKLKEDLKWTERMEGNSTGSVICTDGECTVVKEESGFMREQSYEVKGVEKMNGRKCFKVETRIKNCRNGECKVEHRGTYWVDVEKRITVKFELWYQNLKTTEVNLKEIQNEY